MPSVLQKNKERLLAILNLYREKGSLEAVGKELGLSRERVRQLLVKGSKLGLFEYRPYCRDYPQIPKEIITLSLKNLNNFRTICMENNISINHLKKLLKEYDITSETITDLQIEGRKDKCVIEYNLIFNKLGHHPTTTELQRNKQYRYLCICITRLWGSFDNFRLSLNIPIPPKGNPKFAEDTYEWHQLQKRLNLIKRMDHIDIISEYLNILGPMSASEISYLCDLGENRVRYLLDLLIKRKIITRMNKGKMTKYCLLEKGENND